MSIVDKLIKKIDNDSVIKFSDKDVFDQESTWVHSGIPELDWNLRTYGFPVGITEIAGASKSGKTTLALEGMKNFQHQYKDGVSIILSSENRDNREYAREIGVDTDRVILVKNKFVEDLFFKAQNYIEEICELWREEKLDGKPKIYIMWDSLGATISRAEAETFIANAKIEKQNAAKGTKTEYKHARMASFASSAKAAMKAMLAQIYEKDIIFVILNHLTTNFDTGGKDSTGGSWVEYLPCLRLRTSRKDWIKLDDIEVAQTTKIKVEKNDFGTRKSTEVEILLGYGVVLSDGDIEYAIEKGILKKEGALKISFMGGKLKWSSKRTKYDLYVEKHKLLPVLLNKIKRERWNDMEKERAVILSLRAFIAVSTAAPPVPEILIVGPPERAKVKV